MRLRHPNVLRTFEAGEHRGTHYLGGSTSGEHAPRASLASSSPLGGSVLPWRAFSGLAAWTSHAPSFWRRQQGCSGW
jgi:hypothetical protein